MTVRAYILVQAEVGTAADVAVAVSGLDNIVSADVAMGPYDVIAQAEASDVNHLGRIVITDVQKLPGVERTLLCPVVTVDA
ncbi:MAG: Lrp/AsnC ligand binding domain-containing protein [Acidimicrobiaceae bacterium]|nr:Lrp/AsnC ligand binding domain-containing protein [Acidimicrobiaceae bacterium]